MVRVAFEDTHTHIHTPARLSNSNASFSHVACLDGVLRGVFRSGRAHVYKKTFFTDALLGCHGVGRIPQKDSADASLGAFGRDHLVQASAKNASALSHKPSVLSQKAPM